jgi:hypothetical protein
MPQNLSCSLGATHQLNAACAELDRRLHAGDNNAAEAVLAAYPDLAADPDSALQVIYDELVLREHLGQQPDYAEYYARFPQWREELRRSFEVHEALARRTLPQPALAHPVDGFGREPAGRRRSGRSATCRCRHRCGQAVVSKQRAVVAWWLRGRDWRRAGS